MSNLHAHEKPGPESILYLRVEDIRAAYDTLRARGVEFAADHGAGKTPGL